MGLRVLITNYCLRGYTGTELYVQDLAMELRRQGHVPAVYTPWPGVISEKLSAAGIMVTDSLKNLDFQPDIIHGHHRCETMSAVRRFPNTPAIFICHDHTQWTDVPPLHSHIVRYLGVSKLCLDRLRACRVPERQISGLYNFVDLDRFKPRAPLPAQPGRALVFSNNATQQTFLPAIMEVCGQAGLELDVVGKGVGKPVEYPEDILGQYDIVFAKAKAAMEAMAVGCAVVLCDYGGLGPMVTSKNFLDLKPLNFGFQALTGSHTAENILDRIKQYDPQDAHEVSNLLRSSAGLDHAVAELTGIYQQVIEDFRSQQPGRLSVRDICTCASMPRYLVAYRIKKLWLASPLQRQWVKNALPFRIMERIIKRIFMGQAVR